MTKKTKKGSVQDFIYEAFDELRTVPEVKRYIREKYGKDFEPHERTIYHHIKKIDNGNDQNYILLKKGEKYQFISKKKENTADNNYLIWLMDRYCNAFKNQDQGELYWLRSEIYNTCFKKIENETFIDFIIKLAEHDSYDTYESNDLDLGKNTLTFWDCIPIIKNRVNNSKLEKKLMKTDAFFKTMVLDYKGEYTKYGEERLIAFYKLNELQSPKVIDVALDLMLNINPKRKINFSPKNFRKINEYELFKHQIRLFISSYATWNPIKCRQYLFEVYRKRKKQFGTNDKLVKLLMKEIEHVRSSSFEIRSEKIRDIENEMKKYPDMQTYYEE